MTVNSAMFWIHRLQLEMPEWSGQEDCCAILTFFQHISSISHIHTIRTLDLTEVFQYVSANQWEYAKCECGGRRVTVNGLGPNFDGSMAKFQSRNQKITLGLGQKLLMY